MKKLAIWLSVLVFAVLMPLLLFWSGLRSHFDIQQKVQVEQIFEQMSDELDLIARLHEDRVFFHSLLQANFSAADKSQKPLAVLKKKIAGLKKAFSGKVKFIVWKSNGSLIADLSDENKFQFVMKTMFSLLKNLSELYAGEKNIDLSRIASISNRMKLLRGYFGQFLFEKYLFDPLLPAHLGKCILVSEDEEKRLLWYYPGSNFSLACFISADELNKNTGAKVLISRLKKQKKSFNAAYIETISYADYGLPEDPREQIQIKLEARKFEANGVARRRSSDFLINFRQVSPELIVLTWQRAASLNDSFKQSAKVFFKSTGFLLVVLFAAFCAFLRMPFSGLSVQQKMLLIFLFSNGLPILALVSTGYEFFHEKKDDLINSAHQESLRVLKEFDLRFPVVEQNIAARFNSFIDSRNNIYGAEKWPAEEIEELKKLIKTINPEEALILQSDGSQTFYLSNSVNRAEKLIFGMLQQALIFFNSVSLPVEKKKRSSILEEVSANDLFLNYFLSFIGGFSVQSSANGERSAFLKFVGDHHKGNFWGILAVSWSKAGFMNEFAPWQLKNLANEAAPRILGVMNKKSEELYLSNPVNSVHLMRLLRQMRSRKLIMNNNVVINGKSYLFTSIPGNEISEGILMSLYPREIIEGQIWNLKFGVIAGIMLILLTLIQIVRLFSQRLINPVKGLSYGIERIKQRDFTVRVDYSENDELGQLVSTFNQAAAGMSELAIGTAVQVGLLPPEKFRKECIELFARSIFMSKMGGDYFDYFAPDEKKLVVFFGDVAGHGIPAAMVMAMVKAVVTSVEEDYSGPSDVLARAGLVLQHLKKRNWRRMMTAQCVEFNCQTGEFIISSAGHCYPALVDSSGAECSLLKINGFPLGSASKSRHEEVRGNLKPGETLILYTDGIIEATNSAGEMFDYSRFMTLVKSSWNSELEIYWQNIIAGYRSWASVQDDDLTFMMLRYDEVKND